MAQHAKFDSQFRDEVVAEPGGEHLLRCLSCGTCMAACLIRRAEPQYNPRRILRRAAAGLREEVLGSPLIWLCSACDACYLRCPQDIHISDVFAALRSIALREGYTPPGPVARVNERTCVGCGLCVEVCPYDAVELVEKRVLGRDKSVSQVDAARCMSCGVCAASCRSGSIDLVEFSDEAVFEALQERLVAEAA